MQLKDDNLAKNHPSPQNPPPDDVSIRKDLGNSWKNCVKVPAVHLALFQAVATGSKSACKQPVGSFSACCRGKSCPARGSAEACRALQQQLLQDLRSEPVRELFHTANLSAFYFYSLFCFFFSACGNSSNTFALQAHEQFLSFEMKPYCLFVQF